MGPSYGYNQLTRPRRTRYADSTSLTNVTWIGTTDSTSPTRFVYSSQRNDYWDRRDRQRSNKRRQKINKAAKIIVRNMKIDRDNKSRKGPLTLPAQELPCKQPIWQNHKINSKR